jgi:hypothetical protein
MRMLIFGMLATTWSLSSNRTAAQEMKQPIIGPHQDA